MVIKSTSLFCVGKHDHPSEQSLSLESKSNLNRADPPRTPSKEGIELVRLSRSASSKSAQSSEVRKEISSKRSSTSRKSSRASTSSCADGKDRGDDVRADVGNQNVADDVSHSGENSRSSSGQKSSSALSLKRPSVSTHSVESKSISEPVVLGNS